MENLSICAGSWHRCPCAIHSIHQIATKCVSHFLPAPGRWGGKNRTTRTMRRRCVDAHSSCRAPPQPHDIAMRSCWHFNYRTSSIYSVGLISIIHIYASADEIYGDWDEYERVRWKRRPRRPRRPKRPKRPRRKRRKSRNGRGGWGRLGVGAAATMTAAGLVSHADAEYGRTKKRASAVPGLRMFDHH